VNRPEASRQPFPYYVRRAVDSILATPVISGVTITSICVSVLLAGAVLLVGSNAFRLIQSWGATGVDVSIYLKETSTTTASCSSESCSSKIPR
jgi:cell division protein FtsX